MSSFIMSKGSSGAMAEMLLESANDASMAFIRSSSSSFSFDLVFFFVTSRQYGHFGLPIC